MKIGGENYLNKEFKLNFFEDETYYSSGQSALLVILMTLKNINYKKIYLPNFICDSVYNICKKLDFNIILYEIDTETFEPSWTTIDIHEDAIFYFVSYYGFIDDNPYILKLKLNYRNIITISDRVQDYYNLSESHADFAYNSFRKFLPIPEGALIKNNSNINLIKPRSLNSWSKLKYFGTILKLFKFKDEMYLQYFKKAENILSNTHEPMYMSKFGRIYFNLFNHNKIKENRRNNYKFAYEYGESIGLDFIFDYREGIYPIAIPVRVYSSIDLKEKLYINNCFLNSYWPNFNVKSKFSENMFSHTINIIINDSVNQEKIQKQVFMIDKFNIKK